MSAALAAVCAHCGLPTGDHAAKFCCEGCRAVHDLLVASDLGRYYDLRGERGVPQNDVRPDRHDTKWLDAIEARRESGIERIDLDLQGLHCSACVWLIETLFTRHGGASLAINPAIGRARLVVAASFDLRSFVLDVERFGYRFGPPSSRPVRRSNALLWRLGVCVAIAMNTMIFAIAIYAGLHSGPIYVAFERLNLALSSISVIVGGGVFFRAAWQSVRRGVLHLDLPIALGIGLAFAGSVASFVGHRASGVFVDTLDVFIALMLVGRYLQERVLERNRLAILEDDGTKNLLARRATRGGRVEVVKCVELEAGARIIIAGGDVVPVDARVPRGKRGSFSLDWLNGESTPHPFEENQIVPAGAFSASKETIALVVERDFDRSGLADLLRTPLPRDARASEASRFWDRLSRLYVAGVLVVAAAGFVGWMIATRDLARAIEVTTAVLVVTCPCAFGIATPLAYDLATAGLRRAGLFVRTQGFLDRASRVKTVVFDKTGTLTSGALRVRNPEALDALDDRARDALVDLASATWHPKSAAVLRALGASVATSLPVVEQHARGVSMRASGHEWRLGALDWVTTFSPPSSKLAFGVDGAELATLEIEEDLRPDARVEVAELEREGFDVWLLSGDDRTHTEAAARAAGIPASHAIGACDAQEKAKWIELHDNDDLLMIGDGINDSLAVERATCGGTPAIDRPFMAARSDFYFVTPGLRPIRLALTIARRVTRVRTRNLAFALAYNVLSIGLAYAGVMSPLLCAVLMPASSLVTVLTTVFSLSPRSSSWKS